MRLQRTAMVALGAFALVAALPLAAHAAPELEPFTGVYTLDRNASDDVEEAIEATVSDMSFVTRPVARRRLRRNNTVHDRVTIERRAAGASIAFDDLRPVETPTDGSTVDWEREDGDVFQVTTRIAGGRLEQSFRGDQGVRTNAYALSEDGRTLTMHVKVESDRLPEPLTYRLVYYREG